LTALFQIKDIFDENFCLSLQKKYNLNIKVSDKISHELHKTFNDFMILVLSENNSYTIEERNKIYIESIFNLQKTSKLLEGMPHPASSMSYKLLKMSETLQKITRGGKKEKSKANRFIEKNLVRKFILFWDLHSNEKYLSCENKINYNICKCFLDCSKKISQKHSGIEWFDTCEIEFVESLFENI